MSSEGSMLNDTSHRTKYNQKHCNICINTSKLESIVMCIIKSFIICYYYNQIKEQVARMGGRKKNAFSIIVRVPDLA